jgi:hypothetical protein
MIDFIEATQYRCKYTPNLAHCKAFPCKLNEYGWETYTLQGCKGLEIHWKPESGMLRIKGSLPYWWQSHNFSFSNSDFIESVSMLQVLLGVPLWDASLDAFEYGCIFPVEYSPALYIKNHNAREHSHLFLNEKGRDRGAFRWWDGSGFTLKLYDAGKNIKMKQGLKTRDVIGNAGYDPELHYLKFEMHLNKPEMLNKGRDVELESLQDSSFLQYLDRVLLEQYNLLTPMRTLIQQTNKKNLSALDIVVSVYVENQMNQGISIDEAKSNIYAFINQSGCLEKQDKDARKATIRRVFGKLQESEESQWDLTHKIEDALCIECKE